MALPSLLLLVYFTNKINMRWFHEILAVLVGH